MEKTPVRLTDRITKEQKAKIDTFINRARDEILKFNLSITQDPNDYLNSLIGLMGGIQFVILGTAVNEMIKDEEKVETFERMIDTICEGNKKIFKGMKP